MSDFLTRTFYGNNLQAWLLAAATLILVAGGLFLIKTLVLRRLTDIAQRTQTRADDMLLELLRRTRYVFLIWLALAIALRTLVFPEGTLRLVGAAAVIALLLQIGLWANGAITFVMERYTKERAVTDAATVTTVTAVAFAARLFAWLVLLLLALDNLGVDVTALITGLGITGIAVALAVQNILGDLLAALSIVVDKPFVVGDFITVDTFAGTVEHVGLKTTRLRSLTGEQIIFSNGELLKSRIRNFKRMHERRITFVIGVVYDTPYEKVAHIPVIIRDAVEAQAQTRFDRSHFRGYGDSALEFETVYWVTTPEYGIYMDIQQAINLALFRRFADERIDFAFPTRTVVLKGAGDAAARMETHAHT